MTFQNVHNGSNCNCIDDAKPDNSSQFGLKTNKNVLREGDFKSKWEKDPHMESPNCEHTCSMRGLSVSILTHETMDKVKDIYKQLFPISPSYKPFLSVIKFGQDTGVIKHTPLPNNLFHYDFYKCDTFSHLQIELIETIPLSDNV